MNRCIGAAVDEGCVALDIAIIAVEPSIPSNVAGTFRARS
jgi:hypothetical protein